jgi:hypothetical protein
MSNAKSIPAPRRKHSFAALKTLEVGQSVTFPLTAFDSLGPALHRRQRLDGTRFRRRTEDGLIRVWRIS